MSEEYKKKVLMVHNYYQIPGGEDTVVANEKRLLEEHGHEVILYTRHNNELKSMSKWQKLRVPFTTLFNHRTYKDIKKIIREQQIEIVHVHNTLNLISPSVYYAALRCGVPVVQTVHNFRFLCPGATFYRDGHICEDCVRKGLGCAIKHKCYRGSRAQTLVCVINTWIHRHTGILGKINYITLTEFNKGKLLQLKQIKPERVFVKPNFTFDVPIEEIQNRTQRIYYIYIGRIEEIKGIKLLIEAFRRMPDKLLKLAGDGPLKESLEKEAPSNIEFLGFVHHNNLMKLISDAKAVILPSQIYEGFPMTIPEAFSLHTPMIVGDIGNNGVLIKDGFNGIKFLFNDLNSMILAIERFESSDQTNMGNNAYQDYLNTYSERSNYAIMNSIYRKVSNLEAR